MNAGLPSSPYVIRAEAYQARLQAEAWRQAAADEAEQLLCAARAQAQAIREQARQEGLAEGLARGARLSGAMAEALEQFWEERQAELLELVLAAAHRVLDELPDEQLLHRLAAECLAEHAREDGLVVRVAPSACAALRASLDAGGHRVTVAADPTLAAGDGVLVHASGRTEFGLLAQFRAMLRAGEPVHG